MNNTFKIHDYNNNQYLVNLEEDFNDIWWAIRYVDHGDEFILVCTNDDKIFCYGWWNDRYHFGNYIRDHELFAKKAPWYLNPFSGILWNIQYAIDTYSKTYKESLTDYYQYCFNEIIEDLESAYETGYEYDWTKYKDEIKKFLIVQKLDTKENLTKLENARWTSIRIDNCIGIAAKEDWTKHSGFWCDSVKSIWHEGSWHDTTYEVHDCYSDPILYRNIPYEYGEPDQWGECSLGLDHQEIKNCLAQSVLF